MLLILAGFLAGIVSGMGIGGGTILMPILLQMGFEQKTAQGMNLLYFIPTAVVALYMHRKNGNVEKEGIQSTIGFGFLGVIAGSFLAMIMKPQWLQQIFAIFLIGMGIKELWSLRGEKEKSPFRYDYIEEHLLREQLKQGIPMVEFEALKRQFKLATVDEKVILYVESTGLNQEQYKELLRLFPLRELYRLEAALV